MPIAVDFSYAFVLPHRITPDLVEAYELCKRKAFLLIRGDMSGSLHDYPRFLNARAASTLNRFVDSLEASGRVVERHSDTGWITESSHRSFTICFENR